jgi:hypothetical protein
LPLSGSTRKIAAQARLQAAQLLVPPERIGGITCGHRADRLRRKLLGQMARLDMQVGDLELAEQALGSRRRPVGAQADPHPILQRGGDVGGVAIQPQIAER